MLVAFILATASIPQQSSWDDFVAKTFNPSLCLPQPAAQELVVNGQGVVFLPEKMRLWVNRDFAQRPGQTVAREVQPEAMLLGDLIEILQPLKHDPSALQQKLDSLQEELPGLDRQSTLWLRELISDTDLHSEDWSPNQDSADDGLLFTAPWKLSSEMPNRHPFWQQRCGADDVYQLAVLYFADADSIYATEMDFEQYKQHVDNAYEEIHMVKDSLVEGVDADGKPFAYYKLFYEWDLPFPFSSYECLADVLIRLDEQGHLMTETSARGGDVYWSCSQSLFLPILNREGEQVCAMMVQQFGFDLEGVPDDSDDRLKAFRSQVGSKKRFAEARFRNSDGASTSPDNAQPLDLSTMLLR